MANNFKNDIESSSIKVYVIPSSCEERIDANQELDTISDELFIKFAEEEGWVYTLKGFENFINRGLGFDSDYFFIRFI